MRSIRHTLTRNTCLVVFTVVAALSIAGFSFLRAVQTQSFENALETDLRVVANAVKVWTDGEIYIELNPTLLSDFAAGGDNAFVIRDASGAEVIERSFSLIAANRELSASPGATEDATTWSEEIGPNGAMSVVVTRVLPAQWGWDLDDTSIETAPDVRQTAVQISVAHDRTSLDNSLRNLLALGIIVTFASVLAAGVAVWVGAGRALRPLNDLADRTTEITEPTTTKPFDIAGPVELVPIAKRLNDLLDRLAKNALSERRFTADAAHELRTPIAELRTMTDVALAFPGDSDQLESVVRTSNELSVRLSSLVDALLGIARRETIAGDLEKTDVDVPAQLRGLISDNHAAITKKGLDIVLVGPEMHVVSTDAALLNSIMTNLIGNAVAHAPHGSKIRVSFTGGSRGFRLDVTNPAPDLTKADLDMVFEPFWRQQGAHSDRSHSGLGLTLSRNFADLLGYSLYANLLKSGDVQLTLTSE